MSDDQQQPQVVFSYEKSLACRTIHANGAWGSVTPDGNIYMALFSEHYPLPQRTVNALDEAGGLSGEIMQQRELSDGVVREIEAEVFLSAETAAALRTWLDEKIRSIDEARTRAQRSGTEN